MPAIGLPPASAPPVYCTLNLPERGRKILGLDLSASPRKRTNAQTPH